MIPALHLGSVRTDARYPGAMRKNPRRGLKAILELIRHSPEHSSLHHFLHDHHDAILAALGGRRVGWKGACAAFAKAGLTDRTGKPATPVTARQTWLRVRRHVAKERAWEAKARLEALPQVAHLPPPAPKLAPAQRGASADG